MRMSEHGFAKDSMRMNKNTCNFYTIGISHTSRTVRIISQLMYAGARFDELRPCIGR